MSSTTPEQAILDTLSEPLGTWTPFGEPAPGGWQAGTFRGGRGNVVDLATVRFVKRRRSATRWVYFVAYRAVDPRHGPEPSDHSGVCEVEPADGGWVTRNVSGGGGAEPSWSRPTINLGGGGWPDRFSAGGTVHGAGHELVRVELRFANGVVLEDDTAGGVGLFVTDDHVETPTVAALFDAEGAEVRAYEVLPGS